jgi:hypothetical protein
MPIWRPVVSSLKKIAEISAASILYPYLFRFLGILEPLKMNRSQVQDPNIFYRETAISLHGLPIQRLFQSGQLRRSGSIFLLFGNSMLSALLPEIQAEELSALESWTGFENSRGRLRPRPGCEGNCPDD